MFVQSLTEPSAVCVSKHRKEDAEESRERDFTVGTSNNVRLLLLDHVRSKTVFTRNKNFLPTAIIRQVRLC